MDLLRSIRRVLRLNQFVPFEIQEEFSALMKHRGDDAEEKWFAPRGSHTSSTRRHLEELGTLLDIHHEALEAVTLGRHEAAWNSAVHHRLLTMAFDDCRTATGDDAAQDVRLRVENVTSATVAGDCLPRLRAPKPSEGARYAPSVAALSISEATLSSSSRSSTNSLPVEDASEPGGDDSDPFASQGQLPLDSTVHSKTGSKKVDFAIVCVPSAGSALHTNIQVALDRLKGMPTRSCSVNPSSYGPLVNTPIAIALTTRAATASWNPLVQIALIAAATHRRLHTLPVAGATGSSPMTEEGVIAPLPMIVVTSHQWDLYFACDQGISIVSINAPDASSSLPVLKLPRNLSVRSILALPRHLCRSTCFWPRCGY